MILQAQKRLRVLDVGFQGVRRRDDAGRAAVAGGYQPRVGVGVVQDLTLPERQLSTVADLVHQHVTQLRAKARSVEYQRALLEALQTVVLEHEAVEVAVGRRQSVLRVGAYRQESAESHAAEGVVFDQHGAPYAHVEGLALDAVDDTVEYGHCLWSLDDEGGAAQDAQLDAVQHEFVVHLDVVHRATWHLIAEGAPDDVQKAHVEFLEGQGFDRLDTAVLQGYAVCVHEIGEGERRDLADPHVLEEDGLDVAVEDVARQHLHTAVAHRDARAARLGRGQLEAVTHEGEVADVHQIHGDEVVHLDEAVVGKDDVGAIGDDDATRVTAKAVLALRRQDQLL